MQIICSVKGIKDYCRQKKSDLKIFYTRGKKGGRKETLSRTPARFDTYLLRRNRSGKVTKISCRTRPFTDDKRDSSHAVVCLQRRVLIYSEYRGPPSSPSPPVPLQPGAPSSASDIISPGGGDGPSGVLSPPSRHQPRPRGKRATSEHISPGLGKSFGACATRKEGPKRPALNSSLESRAPWSWSPGLKKVSPASEAQSWRVAAEKAKRQAARLVWRPGKGSSGSKPAWWGRVPPPLQAEAGAGLGARPAQPMGAAHEPPPSPQEESARGRCWEILLRRGPGFPWRPRKEARYSVRAPNAPALMPTRIPLPQGTAL